MTGTMVRSLIAIPRSLALWFVWIPGRRLARFLPYRVLMTAALIGARIFWVVAAGTRRKIKTDLAEAYGRYFSAAEVASISRRSLEQFAMRHAENLIFGRLTAESTRKLVTIEGREHLDAALAKNRGVIIQLAHFGSFLMVLPALGYSGYRINQLVGQPELEGRGWINRHIFRIRVREHGALPVRFMHVDRSLKPVIKALKNNELVAMALDGRDGKEWVRVNLLGRSANLSPGSIRLALLTGAVVLPTFAVRGPDGLHRVIIERPFELEELGTREETVAKNLQRLTDLFETYILKHPCHFGMMIHLIQNRAKKGVFGMPLFSDENDGGAAETGENEL